MSARPPVAPIAAVMSLIALWLLLATTALFRPSIVIGDSMEPALLDHDRVVVDLWTYGRRPPREGEVILFFAPGRDGVMMVKRVVRVDRRTGELWVEGDHAEASSDSRRWGTVRADRLVGRVVYRYWPPRRAGPVSDAGKLRLPGR